MTEWTTVSLYIVLILLGVVVGLLISAIRQKSEGDDGSRTATSTKYYVEEQVRKVAETAYDEGRAAGILTAIPTFGMMLTELFGLERENAEEITSAMTKAWTQRLREHGYKEATLKKILGQVDEYIKEVWTE